MCGPQEDSDIMFGPVRHFGWHSCLHLRTTNSLQHYFFAHVTFTCIESVFSYPHKEFLIPRPTRTKFNPGTHKCGFPQPLRKCGYPQPAPRRILRSTHNCRQQAVNGGFPFCAGRLDIVKI